MKLDQSELLEIVGFFSQGIVLIQRKSLILILSCSKESHFTTGTKLFIYLKTTKYLTSFNIKYQCKQQFLKYFMKCENTKLLNKSLFKSHLSIQPGWLLICLN